MKALTLLAIDTDPVSHPLTRYAVHRTLSGVNAAEVLFFGTQPLGLGERFVKIERFDSIDSYSEFVFKCLWPFICTEFVFIVHWDGFASNPQLWEDAFLDFDYIGAPWDFYKDAMNVGNGGFCIRSKRLLMECRSPTIRRFPEVQSGGAEDVVICRIHRQHLEAQGMRFAPREIAARFSYETGPFPGRTFGFHSPHNMPLNMNEADLIKLANPLKRKIRQGPVRDAFVQNCRAMGHKSFLEIFEERPSA